MSKALRTALFLGAWLGASAASAQLSGPMSSGKPPEVPAQGAGANTSAPPTAAELDVEKLFANTCGWCHSSAGRTAGRGPKLADITLTDAEIVSRINKGKAGAMPAFAGNFSEGQLRAIVQYIRGLKEEGAPK